MSVHTEITVAELLQTYPGKFYRLTNDDETHRDVTYRTGLNIDHLPFNPTGECQEGGMYFFHEDNINIGVCCFPSWMKWLREVTFPDDARIYVEENKFKADKFILGEREVIPTWVYAKSVSFCGTNIRYVPETMMTQEMCLVAVKQYGYSLYYVPNRMMTAEMCFEAVKTDGVTLLNVPSEMKTVEMCFEAVKQNGCALQYVPVNMKTVEMCSEAVKQTYHAIDYVPSNMLTDEMRVKMRLEAL